MVQTRSQKARWKKTKKQDSISSFDNQFSYLENTSDTVSMAVNIDPCFASVDSLWKELITVESLVQLVTTLGPLTVGRFDFNGFDAKRIIQGMIDIAKAKKITKAQFFKDVIDIIIIGLARGNIREDQIGRTVEGGDVRIRELATTYNIPIKANKQTRSVVDGNRLTFVRSISLFPHIASLLQHNSEKLVRDVYRSSLKSNSLPSSMKHTGFAALIPKTIDPRISAVFFYAHAAYMVDFSRQINETHRNMSVIEVYNIQTNFCKLAMNNSMYEENDRLTYMVAFDLNTRENFTKIYNVADQMHLEVNGVRINNMAQITALFKNNVIVIGGSEAEANQLNVRARTLASSLQIQDNEPVASTSGATPASDFGNMVMPFA